MRARARLGDGDVRFIFGDYVLDPGRRELTARGQTVAIGPKVFDLLLHLVANRDRVTGKDELLQAVWAGRIVSESTITSHINAVRKAIGDSGEAQRLVRTVARKGFRFIGEVSLDEAEGAPEAPAGEAHGEPRPVPALALPDRPSITVLPFQNLSGDPEQQYFTDGVVEAENSAGKEFGLQRLVTTFDEALDGPLAAMPAKIVCEVAAFQKRRHHDDDVCVVAVEVSPGAVPDSAADAGVLAGSVPRGA